MDTKDIVKEKVLIKDIYTLKGTFYHTNYDCFKCGKHSFHIYEDQNFCQCWNEDCKYKGDVIQVYMDENQCDFIAALTKLALKINIVYDASKETILLPEQKTHIDRLTDDIIFLGHCRSLMGYYNISYSSISSQYGLNASRFNKVLRGEYDGISVSDKEYYKIMSALRTHFTSMFERYYKELDSKYYAKLQLERNGITYAALQQRNDLYSEFYIHKKLHRRLQKK